MRRECDARTERRTPIAVIGPPTVRPVCGPFVTISYKRYAGPFSGPRSPVFGTVCSRSIFRASLLLSGSLPESGGDQPFGHFSEAGRPVYRYSANEDGRARHDWWSHDHGPTPGNTPRRGRARHLAGRTKSDFACSDPLAELRSGAPGPPSELAPRRSRPRNSVSHLNTPPLPRTVLADPCARRNLLKI